MLQSILYKDSGIFGSPKVNIKHIDVEIEATNIATAQIISDKNFFSLVFPIFIPPYFYFLGFFDKNCINLTALIINYNILIEGFLQNVVKGHFLVVKYVFPL